MNELTNTRRKMIKSLDSERHRRDERLFKAEGTKCVFDLAEGFVTEDIYATEKWLSEHPDRQKGVTKCNARDMERMSSMTTPPGVLSVMRIRDDRRPRPAELQGKLTLALDSIRDPGNLGTIIRVADWFGITELLCSDDTVDCYSPKVVQATMGSLARVSCHYLPLADMLESCDIEIFGTFLEGDNLFITPLPDSGIIVIGNESRGISEQIASLVDRRITIPSYPAGAATGESLNAAVATSITIAAFRQQSWQRKR